MAHPQSTPRGFVAHTRIDVGSKSITSDSTGIILPAIKLGSWSTAITVDSTGILIGARYISTNTTGNATT